MKINKRIYAVFIILIISLQVNSQSSIVSKETKNLEITGFINGLKEGETVYLKQIEVPGFGVGPIVDSTVVRGGKFILKHFVPDGPRLFWIGFSKRDNKIAVALDNEKVTIRYDKSIDSLRDESAFKHMQVDGSKTANQFAYLNYLLRDTWELTNGKIEKAIKKFEDSTFSRENLNYLSGLLEAKKLSSESIGQILIAHPVHEVIPEFFEYSKGHFQRDSVFHLVFQRLDGRIKNSYYGKLMQEKLYLCMGQNAPDFSFIQKDNRKSSLNSIISKQKLTILHFWSTGSVERVRIHDELVQIYKKYKSKGLEVVSISSDVSKDKWLRTASTDQIPGIQIFDPIQDSSIASLYKIQPDWTVNILVDENGKMIAYDADGANLRAHLFRIFGE